MADPKRRSMKTKTAGKKRSNGVKERRRKLVLEFSGLFLIVLMLFIGWFHVTSVEVVGNSGKNYTDREIREMALPEFWTGNSALLRLFRRRIDLTDVRFMESIEVEVKSRNSIRLHVYEKKPVGFVRLNERDFYFDHEGIVLEIMSAEETAQLKQEAAETVSAENASEAPESVVQTESGEGQTEGEASVLQDKASEDTAAEETSEESVQQFNPNLADVPMITGLPVSEVPVGQKLPLSESSFFNTIQFLTKMIDKYNIQPDYVEVTEDVRGKREMTLFYGNVRAALGTDSELEEKVTRLAAILPKLAGRSGILHLEEYSADTINIVFDEDQ